MKLRISSFLIVATVATALTSSALGASETASQLRDPKAKVDGNEAGLILKKATAVATTTTTTTKADIKRLTTGNGASLGVIGRSGPRIGSPPTASMTLKDKMETVHPASTDKKKMRSSILDGGVDLWDDVDDDAAADATKMIERHFGGREGTFPPGEQGHRSLQAQACSDDWILTPDLEYVMAGFSYEFSYVLIPYVLSSCRSLEIKVYEKGCATEVPSKFVSVYVNPPIGGDTNDREITTAKFDIARDNITESSIFNGTDPSNSVIEMCIRGDLVEDVGGTIESVSFVETELSLTIDMTQGFNVTTIDLNRNNATEAEESANLDYEVDAYLCDSSGTNSTDAISQQDDIFICVESKSTDVGINSIDSLTFLQEGVGPSLQLPAIVAGEPNALTTVPYDGSDSKKLIIKSKLLSSFFDPTNLVDVKVDGVVIMQFQDDGTRRLAKTSQSGRTLQQPEDSIAGDASFDTRFQLAPLEVNTNELNDDSSSPGRSIAGVFVLLAHAAVVFAVV